MRQVTLSFHAGEQHSLEHNNRMVDEKGKPLYKNENIKEELTKDNVYFNFYENENGDFVMLEKSNGKFFDMSGKEIEIENFQQSITKSEDIKKFYDKTFQEAWKEFYDKQRPARIAQQGYKENYFEYISEKAEEGKEAVKEAKRNLKDYNEIRKAKTYTKTVKELIVQFGDKKDLVEPEIAVPALKEVIRDFEKNNPGFKIVNAAIHVDESSVHAHIDYVNVVECKRGARLQNSQNQALKLNGCYVPKGSTYEDKDGNIKTVEKDTPMLTMWQDKQREIIKEKALKYNLEIVSAGCKEQHREKDAFVRHQQTMEKLQEEERTAEQKAAEAKKAADLEQQRANQAAQEAFKATQERSKAQKDIQALTEHKNALEAQLSALNTTVSEIQDIEQQMEAVEEETKGFSNKKTGFVKIKTGFWEKIKNALFAVEHLKNRNIKLEAENDHLKGTNSTHTQRRLDEQIAEAKELKKWEPKKVLEVLKRFIIDERDVKTLENAIKEEHREPTREPQRGNFSRDDEDYNR